MRSPSRSRPRRLTALFTLTVFLASCTHWGAAKPLEPRVATTLERCDARHVLLLSESFGGRCAALTLSRAPAWERARLSAA